MADAETILRNLLNEIFAKLMQQNVQIRSISSGGANYTSALYSVDVNHQRKNLKLFAKVAIIGEKMRARVNAGRLYKTEELVYTQLTKIYNGLQEKHEVPEENRFVFPKFYGCKTNCGEETFVLEDLDARGFKIYDRLKSLDWDHAAIAVTAMARFHALSFAYQKEHPEEFEIIAEKMIPQEFVDKDDEAVKETWVKIIGGAVQVLKEEHRGKLINFFGPKLSLEEYIKFKMPLSRTLLSHGDYRPSNLLFRRHNGALETIVVDFQTLHSGSPVSDLLYLIFVGTDEEFRRDHYQQLLDHYYQELTLASDRLKVDITEVYPRETFDSELKELLPHALRMSVVILPIVTVDVENAPLVKGDADLGEFAIKPNELFAERFRGIVSDCVRWGVI